MIEINNIDDIIDLVKADALTDELFIQVVENCFQCFCPYSLSKEDKIKYLEIWKDADYLNSNNETPLFFEISERSNLLKITSCTVSFNLQK
jgi:hypothetical protein